MSNRLELKPFVFSVMSSQCGCRSLHTFFMEKKEKEKKKALIR